MMKITAMMMATTTTAMMIPAIAPPLIPDFFFVVFVSLSSPLVGVDVGVPVSVGVSSGVVVGSSDGVLVKVVRTRVEVVVGLGNVLVESLATNDQRLLMT